MLATSRPVQFLGEPCGREYATDGEPAHRLLPSWRQPERAVGVVDLRNRLCATERRPFTAQGTRERFNRILVEHGQTTNPTPVS